MSIRLKWNKKWEIIYKMHSNRLTLALIFPTSVFEKWAFHFLVIFSSVSRLTFNMLIKCFTRSLFKFILSRFWCDFFSHFFLWHKNRWLFFIFIFFFLLRKVLIRLRLCLPVTFSFTFCFHVIYFHSHFCSLFLCPFVRFLYLTQFSIFSCNNNSNNNKIIVCMRLIFCCCCLCLVSSKKTMFFFSIFVYALNLFNRFVQ